MLTLLLDNGWNIRKYGGINMTDPIRILIWFGAQMVYILTSLAAGIIFSGEWGIQESKDLIPGIIFGQYTVFLLMSGLLIWKYL